MANASRRTLLTTGGMMIAASSAAVAATGQPVSPQPVSPAPVAPVHPGLSSFAPPSTDAGDLGALTFSFDNARARQTGSGWIRSITAQELPIAQKMSANNLRLQAGAIYAAHWQSGAVWGFVQDGEARLAIVDHLGRRFTTDMGKGDIWYAPAGLPCTMQGLGANGCNLVTVESGCDPVSFGLLDWLAHTPRDVIASDLGVAADSIRTLPGANTLIFGADETPAPKSEDNHAHGATSPYHFPMMAVRPIDAKGGRIRIADMNNFRTSTGLCATLVELEPGGMREMHYHPDADEMLIVLGGFGRMTVFAGGRGANTVDLNRNSVGYIPRRWGHYLENIGPDKMLFLEVMNSGEYRDVSLKSLLANMPAELMAAHLKVDPAFIRSLGKDKTPIVPI